VKKGLWLSVFLAGALAVPQGALSRDPEPPYPPISMPPGTELPYPVAPIPPPAPGWDVRPEALSPEQLFREAVAAIGKIVIDPGHGGYDPGLEGEKEMTLSLAQKLESLYTDESVKVVLTRTSNRHVSLADRADVVRTESPAFFLSLHMGKNRFMVHAVSAGRARETSARIRDRIVAGLSRAFGSAKVYDRQLPLYLTQEVTVPGVVLEIPSDMNFSDDEGRTALFKIITLSLTEDDGTGRRSKPY